MYVERHGTGDHIFFGLHGWGGDHSTFAPLIKYLPETATIYAADLPGYGRSPAPAEWRLEAIADEVAAAMLATAAPRLTVVGNCSGAIITLAAAQRITDRIERLILIDPFAFMPWYFRIFAAGDFGRVAYYSTFANPLGRWLTNLSLARRRTDSSHLTRSFSEINHAASLAHLRMLAGIRDIAPFGNLRMPIDILYGERTFPAVKQSVNRWQNLWPQARSIELKGAGHLPIEEATPRLSEIIFDFQKQGHGKGGAIAGADADGNFFVRNESVARSSRHISIR
jgi:pimeloyl-ACP methyl ester carboxylesterase